MNYLTKTLLIIHIIAGSIAVLVGLVALVLPKPLVSKRGRPHRLTGKGFVACMAVVIGSATVLTLLSFNPYFAGLTATALIAVFSGYRVLGRKRPDLSEAQRARAVDWIVALLVVAVGATLIVMVTTKRVTENIPVVYALAAGSVLYGAYDLYRFARPLSFPFTPNLWFYEHLVKMIGGYSGAVAAFSGSVLVILPPPWKQLWATMLGQTLMIVLVIYYRQKLKTRKLVTGTSQAQATAAGNL